MVAFTRSKTPKSSEGSVPQDGPKAEIHGYHLAGAGSTRAIEGLDYGGRNLPIPNARFQHWHTVGARQSPLSGGPRLAVIPVHAGLERIGWHSLRHANATLL